jgi:hypothetical protein
MKENILPLLVEEPGERTSEAKRSDTNFWLSKPLATSGSKRETDSQTGSRGNSSTQQITCSFLGKPEKSESPHKNHLLDKGSSLIQSGKLEAAEEVL